MTSLLNAQLSGALIALIMHALILVPSIRLGRLYWPIYYYLGLILTGGILTCQATSPVPHLTVAVMGTLVLLTVWSLPGVIRHSRAAKLPPVSWINMVAALALAVCFAFAAFPAYRYDQWNYHLSVAKIISNMGYLPLPVFDDHIYFTNVYEYLFLLPRLVTSNDILSHTSADAFSWLSYLTMSYGVFWFLREKYHWKMTSPFLLAAFMYAAAPEHEALINAKSNVFLIHGALFCFALMPAVLSGERFAQILLGLILTGTIALKVTWLLFLVPFCLALPLTFAASRRRPIDPRWVVLGGVAGFIVCLPFFYKNYFFFGNPLHPGQIFIFKSKLWSAGHAAHWIRDTAPAYDLISYLDILGSTPWSFVSIGCWYLPALAGGVWVYLRHDAARRDDRFLWLLLVIAWVLFMFMWPTRFDPRLQPRYIDAQMAFLVFALCLALRRVGANTWISVLLLAPVLASTSLDVRLRKMYSALSKYGDVDSYYKAYGPPLDIKQYLDLVNAHRQRTFGAVPMNERILLADNPITYLADSLRLRINYYDFNYILAEKRQTRPDICVWDVISELSANYLFVYADPESKWPAIFEMPLARAKRLDPEGHARYLSEELINAERQKCPGR